MFISGFGADYAMDHERSLYCLRIPLHRTSLEQMRDWLNARNDGIRKTEYHWNVVTDNCSHLTHNTLASASLVPPKRTGKRFRLKDKSAPFDDLVAIADAAFHAEFDWWSAFRNPTLRKGIDLFDQILPTPGVVVDFIPKNTRNDVFDLDNDAPWFSPTPDVHKNGYKKKFRRFYTESRYTSLGKSLEIWRDRYIAARDGYRRALADGTIRAKQTALSAKDRVTAWQFERFIHSYGVFIERTAAEAEAALEAYREFSAR